MEQIPSWEADNNLRDQDTESLLLCSQQPIISPCPEPVEYSPHLYILFSK